MGLRGPNRQRRRQPDLCVQSGWRQARPASTKGTFGEADLAGTVTGKTIKFSIKVDAQGTPLTIIYDGEIESNTAIKGKVDLGGMGAGTFTGKRTK